MMTPYPIIWTCLLMSLKMSHFSSWSSDNVWITLSITTLETYRSSRIHYNSIQQPSHHYSPTYLGHLRTPNSKITTWTLAGLNSSAAPRDFPVLNKWPWRPPVQLALWDWWTLVVDVSEVLRISPWTIWSISRGKHQLRNTLGLVFLHRPTQSGDWMSHIMDL